MRLIFSKNQLQREFCKRLILLALLMGGIPDRPSTHSVNIKSGEPSQALPVSHIPNVLLRISSHPTPSPGHSWNEILG